MVNRIGRNALEWQSRVILLIVVPWTAAQVLLQAHWWLTEVPQVAWMVFGIIGLFGLIVWRLHAGTPAAVATGAAITASLMFSTTRYPYQTSWLHGALLPVLAVFLLAFAATKVGKRKKELIGTGEGKRGRNAAQVAANLGVAALVAQASFLAHSLLGAGDGTFLATLAALAALSEAAADTVSSEIGQVFGGQPRMITTLRPTEAGIDGGITLLGTGAGILAAVVVSGIGVWVAFGDAPLMGPWVWIGLAALAGTFGLFFDSVLGATLERKGWLNNDAVNFLSTLSAAVFALLTAWVLESKIQL